ncbi:unnamed protein product [Scytosiphon promiscuus]
MTESAVQRQGSEEENGDGAPTGSLPSSTTKKRVPIVNNPEEFTSFGQGGDAEIPSPAVPKSDEARAALSAALREHFLFAQLAPSDLAACVDVMGALEVSAGEDIVVQGERGSRFFVMESGSSEAYVNGERVCVYGPGGSFGELALMYNCERAATVRATADSRLWTMDLSTFRRSLATTASSQIVSRCEFLRKVPFLTELNNEQVNKLADALEEREFAENEYIIKQGQQGEDFFLIEEGVVSCTQAKSATDPTEMSLLTLGKGEYFGEMALMLEEPRAANCIATEGKVKCLSLDRTRFSQLLGPIYNILQQNMRLRILKGVPLLSKLTNEELCKVAGALCVQSFDDGDYIIRQGEEGTRFFIINEGEVRCTCNVPGTGEEREIMRLGKSEFFGERALLKNEPRAANVIGVGYVDCLVLERTDFINLLGPLQPILEREAEKRGQVGELIVGPAKAKGPAVSLSDLVKVKTLGTGTFGRVKLVQHRKTKQQVFAMKCMQKAHIAKSHQSRNIMNEKNILMACDHSFILDLLCTYNTANELLMLTELLLGGELWSYIYERHTPIPKTGLGGFPLNVASFFCGCVVLPLQYLHQMSVAYRDLKPENLLLGQDGYLKVIDFGFAKRIPFKKDNTLQTKSFTLCGTPDYLAPELVLSRGHDKAVDYWALGCFLYELLCGKTPFTDPRQAEIFKKAIRSERFLAFPQGFPATAQDLIRRLLTPNATYRLGNLSGGIQDIMLHPMFNEVGFDWRELYHKRMIPPHKPKVPALSIVLFTVCRRRFHARPRLPSGQALTRCLRRTVVTVRSALDTSNFEAVSEEDKVLAYTGPQKLFEGF